MQHASRRNFREVVRLLALAQQEVAAVHQFEPAELGVLVQLHSVGVVRTLRERTPRIAVRRRQAGGDEGADRMGRGADRTGRSA